MDNVADIQALAEAISRIPELENENETLRESIADVRAMMNFEDRNWLALGIANVDDLEGLDLDQVKEIAEKVSPKVSASSLAKRAVDLHSGFVWGRGCYVEGTEKPKGAGRPKGSREFFIRKTNQESVFSDTAREELQKERFITGNVLAAVNSATKNVNRIPFKQITGIKVDPDYPENIIAYQRTWNTQVGNESIRKRWYYTSRFTGTRKSSFGTGNEAVEVEKNVTIVDLRVNRQLGQILGVPDALAGLLWAESYGRVMKFGETVQESLAKILYRVTNKTKQGTQSTGVKVANFGGHGGTASMAEGQELTSIATAGRGYDFASARPLAAMAASAWNVSNMDLLNDSAAAGSSYGSANALVGGNRNAMLLMQKEWADFYKDIFEAAGFERPSIMFEPFEAPDKYREMQSLKLAQDGLSNEEYRMKLLDIQDISGDPAEIPESLELAVAAAKTAIQTPAPDQGVANGSGGGGQGANDQRSDSVSQSEAIRREMANEEYLNRLESLVERMENAKS